MPDYEDRMNRREKGEFTFLEKFEDIVRRRDKRYTLNLKEKMGYFEEAFLGIIEGTFFYIQRGSENFLPPVLLSALKKIYNFKLPSPSAEYYEAFVEDRKPSVLGRLYKGVRNLIEAVYFIPDFISGKISRTYNTFCKKRLLRKVQED